MNQLFFQYMSYSHLIIFIFCFLILEKIYREKITTVIYYLLLSVVGVIVGVAYSTLDLLVLFVLFFVFSYKVFPQRDAMQIILSIMCSAMIELSFTPFYVMVIPYFLKVENEIGKSITLFVVFFLSLIICSVVSTIFREKLYPYLIRKKVSTPISFLSMVLVLGYQTIEVIRRYAENQNLLFMLLIFYCLLSGLSIVVVHSLSQKALIEAEFQKNKKISELQKQYVDEVKKQYQKTRKFRHDYANLLSTINYYLENDKITELKVFFPMIL
ncbi:hypothetical protein [Enterococcus gilvus]|uniref:hypothetical protein n=1 Tax=Enterococcus gilvus TaxID=160453 RepID=UPI001C8C1F30|nr:hypothetical protein [Enterococcus gilvus]MBX8937146.1 hypothetical protein [Enterococcus gilvus]